jgi:hypothetical protein
VTSLGTGLRVDTLAQSLLDTINDHFAAGPTANALPARQYVAAGDPNDVAWDAEQLTVCLQGIAWGVAEESYPQNVQVGANAMALVTRHAVYEIELLRCLPTTGLKNGVPDLAALNEFGLSYLRDCGLMSQATVAFAAELRHGLAVGAIVRPGIVTTKGPQGGYVAVNCPFYISAMDLS